MTQSSHDVFQDRRTNDQRNAGLATQILYWYDEEGRGRSWNDPAVKGERRPPNSMKRRRVNGVAVTTDGCLFVSRATCSRKDQFIRSHGRMVVESRILGNAQQHCWKLIVPDGDNLEKFAENCAAIYAEEFPDDERGRKRAYNAGNVFVRYRNEIERRANELSDDYEFGQ